MAKRYNFSLDQGADFQLTFVCSTCEGQVSLEGFSAKMQVKQSQYGRIVDELTNENSRLLIDEEKGTVTAIFPHENTETYPAATLIYDMELISADGRIYKLLNGTIVVKAEVTK